MQNQEVTTIIEDISHDGRGIAHVNGKTVFISGALPFEEVNFIYTKKRGKFDEGVVVDVIKAAPNRAEPKCPYFGICGGCSLQHLEASAQLQLKQQVLLEQLQHFGKTQPEEVLDPLTAPIWGYRRKARLGVKYVAKKAKVLVGFREKNGRFLADMDNCEILDKSVGLKLRELGDFIASLDSYQTIPQIEVAVGDKITALVWRHLEDLSFSDIEKLKGFGEKNNFYIYLQPKGPDSVFLLYPENGTNYLSYEVGESKLDFYPTDFTQVNAGINQQMVPRALQLLDPNADDTILDLFCGLGNFTIPLAKKCKSIVGVEGSDEMVMRAKMNADLNGVANAEFYAANLAADCSGMKWLDYKYDKLLLDPPRTGALEIIQSLAKNKFAKILYVSCNPATLARDAGTLIQQGYRLQQAGIMDMFPHTSHVEAMALFMS